MHVFIYLSVCVYIHTHVIIYHVYIYMSKCLYLFIYTVCMHVFIYLFLCVYIHTHVIVYHVYIHMSMCLYLDTNIYVCKCFNGKYVKRDLLVKANLIID